MPEERLAVVLGSSQVAAAGTHPVTRCERGVGLLHELVGEPRHCWYAVAGRDLGSDIQALANVRHAGIALPNRALELAIEILIIEVQLHGALPKSRSTDSRHLYTVE